MKQPYHLDGPLHLTGKSRFVGDYPKPDELQFIRILYSPYAKAKILSIDTTEAEKLAKIITYKDIPGPNQIGHLLPDEVLLAETEVVYVGQPVALAVSADAELAERAVQLIKVEYREETPVLTIDQALLNNDLYMPERRIETGDIEAGFKNSDYIIEDVIESGGQEHFYMETQRCLAVPGEDHEVTLYSATQSTSETQEIAARILNVRSKDVTVDVKRLGGAFGGKERTAVIWSCLAALACSIVRKPVELVLPRIEDMISTGKRHPFKSKYKMGFNKDGKIQAYSVELNSNGGASIDLSMAILERAMLHSDNIYYLPNARIIGRACRTNYSPNTAFRGFGAPQGIFVIERALTKMAQILKKDVFEIRKINAYQEGQLTPFAQPVKEACSTEILDMLQEKSAYQKLVQENIEFNKKKKFLKRGIGIAPVKFGISFTTAFLNQGASLVWVYTDGSISVTHGGIEMGQEVNTKVAQTVSCTLGVTLENIRVESSHTKRVANASPTAASTGSDLNCNAALNACQQIKSRLIPVAEKMLEEKFGIKVSNVVFKNNIIYDLQDKGNCIAFTDLIHRAYMERVNLGAQGFYATPGVHFDRASGKGNPFFYFVFGAALAHTEVDILTGMHKLLAVHIVHETGTSINSEIDKGQIAGAFFQGYGWSTFEELVWNEKGMCISNTPSTYKIPCYRDLPEVFEITCLDRERKESSALGSKGIGEPPLIYGEAVWFAIKDALEAIGEHQKEADLKMPATPEAVLMAAEKLY